MLCLGPHGGPWDGDLGAGGLSGRWFQRTGVRKRETRREEKPLEKLSYWGHHSEQLELETPLGHSQELRDVSQMGRNSYALASTLHGPNSPASLGRAWWVLWDHPQIPCGDEDLYPPATVSAAEDGPQLSALPEMPRGKKTASSEVTLLSKGSPHSVDAGIQRQVPTSQIGQLYRAISAPECPEGSTQAFLGQHHSQLLPLPSSASTSSLP